MTTILISGFEPFHNYEGNSSLEIAQRLDGETLVDGTRIVGCRLPVVRGESATVLLQCIEEYDPIVVLALGQANRKKISIERVAINVDDYSIEDNDGNKVTDQVIIADGPAAYWSTLPIKRLQRCLQQKEIPVNISNSAGTFVCNHLFFQLQHALRNRDVRSGFIHVPLLPAEVDSDDDSTISLELMVQAIGLLAQETIYSLRGIQS